LVQSIRIVEKIGTVGRAVKGPRLLNLDEQHTQGLVEFLVHDGGLDTEDGIDVLDMFKVLVQVEFPQDIPHLVVGELFRIGNTLLLDTGPDGLDNLVRDLGRLLGLELGKNLFEVVEPDVRGIRYLVGGFLVGGLGIVDDMGDEGSTLGIVTDEDTLLVLGDELSLVAFLTHVRGDDEILEIDELVVDVFPVVLVGVAGLTVFLAMDIRGVFVGTLDLEKLVQETDVLATSPLGNVLLLLKVVENVLGVLQKVSLLGLFQFGDLVFGLGNLVLDIEELLHLLGLSVLLGLLLVGFDIGFQFGDGIGFDGMKPGQHLGVFLVDGARHVGFLLGIDGGWSGSEGERSGGWAALRGEPFFHVMGDRIT